MREGHTKIDCVTPFASDIDNIFLEVDRKYQELTALVRRGVEPDRERCKMKPEEKRANLSIDPHVTANSI